MFGFQRVGDQIWCAADSRARGFLLGATAGRTTLNGEGLQHQDGHSLLTATTVPNCIAYDPAFAYEIGVIIKEGLRRMYDNNEDLFYYLTLYNENYPMPPIPRNCEKGIIQGIYKLKSTRNADLRLIGSGSIMQQILKASEILDEFGLKSEIWSATSFGGLRRDALLEKAKNTLCLRCSGKERNDYNRSNRPYESCPGHDRKMGTWKIR
jgi:pyruvate dehydrogenase E1 component